MNWLPRPIFVNEDVCEDDELSHNCGDGGFRFFAGLPELFVD